MTVTAQFLPTLAFNDQSTWLNPNNVLLDDDLFATATLSRALNYPTGFSNSSTGTLYTSTFTGLTAGMALGDTIDGIEIEVRAKCSNAALGVALSVSPSYSGLSDSQLLTEDWAVYTYGGPTSTFGLALYNRSASAIASTSVLMSAVGTLGYGSATVSVEYIKVRVYWSETSCDDFTFTPQSGVALKTWIYSNIITIAGMPSDFVAPTYFAGTSTNQNQPTSEAQICRNNDGRWMTLLYLLADGLGSVNGDTYQIRRKMNFARVSDTFATNYPLYINGVTKYFTMTTIAIDRSILPAFAPRATTGLPRNTLVKAPFTNRVSDCNTIYLFGDSVFAEGTFSWFPSVFGLTNQQFTDYDNPFFPPGLDSTYNPKVRGPYDSSFFWDVYNGSYIEYWALTSPDFNTSWTADVYIGDQNPSWTYTTEAATLTPTQAYWASPAAVNTSTLTTTATAITIAGINSTATVTFSTSGGTSHEFQKNAGAWTAVGGGTTVVVGDTIKVRMISPAGGSQSGNITMKVNGGTGMHASFTIVTTGGDVTPNAFTFTDVTSVAGLLNTSNAQVLAGVTAAQPILATVSPGFQIRVGAGAWTDGSLSVANGDSITIRGYAPLQANSVATCVVTIGGTQDTWTITSRASHAFWD